MVKETEVYRAFRRISCDRLHNYSKLAPAVELIYLRKPLIGVVRAVWCFDCLGLLGSITATESDYLPRSVPSELIRTLGSGPLITYTELVERPKHLFKDTLANVFSNLWHDKRASVFVFHKAVDYLK